MTNKPENKFKLEILFDREADIKLFMGYWLDGGGEQGARMYTDDWGDDWIYIPEENVIGYE